MHQNTAPITTIKTASSPQQTVMRKVSRRLLGFLFLCFVLSFLDRINIGFAGLKDASAVTRQTLSIEHVPPERIEQLDLPNIKIIWTDRHRNKLKIGHLAGNRFSLKIRQITDDDHTLQLARQIMDILTTRGAPNYFGYQRFGLRGDSWLLGRAIIQRDHKELIDRFCGRPGPADHDAVLRARQFYDQGRYELAMEIWPHSFRDAKRICSIMLKSAGSHEKAVRAIDPRLKRLFVSAYQSYLFNCILAERMASSHGIDQIVQGDFAYKHDNGAGFLVTDADAEQARAQRFEISPTGPIYGYRMQFADGQPGQLEHQVLQAQGLTIDSFKGSRPAKAKGTRRPMRFEPTDCNIDLASDKHGRHLILEFTLPSGCYATAVLSELLKENLLKQTT